ncbi:macro domain-containing protein [Burkholderia ubonensis]|uniref:macro domain-containing protein n=1 Tax=Burkholderia ubonensis TaxID=101571 RepID=UPI0008FE2445|nr:macro domain-containing protein [Burkholderia ubonensis]
MKKEYFRSKSEFPCGPGVVSIEFIDGVATRQVSQPEGGVAYSSSSIQDWSPDIGFLLFDGMRDELDIPPEDKIEQNDFERDWRIARNNPPHDVSIAYVAGDATVPLKESSLIAHVANNCGKWGRGFVVALGQRYPLARRAYLDSFHGGLGPSLGTTQFVQVDDQKRIYVANMIAQDGIKKNGRDAGKYISYNYLKDCLEQICEFSMARRLSIQMPMIGAGLGGGDWNIISSIIDESFSRYKLTCTIMRLK